VCVGGGFAGLVTGARLRDVGTARRLKAWYRQLCKRPCFHDEYLQAFNNPNTHLVDTDGQGVEQITAGVVAAGREWELDCIIYGSGFEVGTPYARRAGFEVTGRGGTLSEYWADGMRTLHRTSLTQPSHGLRAAISGLIATAGEHGARAIVIEDLDFAEARAEGRERHGNRPSRGRRGRAFRRLVAGIPTGKLRDRLTQMSANAGLHVIVTDPAYTSRWGAGHWLGPLREHHPKATGHHAAALATGRRGLGHRARRRATGNQPAPEEAARPAQARPRTKPAARSAPRKPATTRGPGSHLAPRPGRLTGS
jgi:hypothetical protein